MFEELYEICDDMLKDEEESKKFLEIDSMDDMYEYFLSRSPGLSKEDFDAFVANLLEQYDAGRSSMQELSDGDIQSVTGGAMLGMPLAATILASLTLVTGTMSTLAYRQKGNNNFGSSSSVVTQLKEKAASAKSSLLDRISHVYQKTSNWIKKNPEKVATGAAVTLGTIVAGAAVGATLRSKSKSDSTPSTYKKEFEFKNSNSRFASAYVSKAKDEQKRVPPPAPAYVSKAKDEQKRAPAPASVYVSKAKDEQKRVPPPASAYVSKAKDEQKRVPPPAPAYVSKAKDEQKRVPPPAPAYVSKAKDEQKMAPPPASAYVSKAKDEQKKVPPPAPASISENVVNNPQMKAYEARKLTSNDVKQALEEMQIIGDHVRNKSKVGSMVDFESWQKVSNALTNLKRILRHKDEKFLQNFVKWRTGLESQKLPLNDPQSEKFNGALDEMEKSLRG